MKNKVQVAMLQMEVQLLKPEANLAKMQKTIESICSQSPVDLIVFPELANSGYLKATYREFGPSYLKVAEPIPGPFTTGLSEMARKHGVYIIAGLLEAHPDITATVYNSAVLIDPAGDIVGLHHKMHIPSEEKHYFYPGNTVDVYATELGKIAMQVCADVRFPELSRVQTLLGAEIICAVFARPRREPYLMPEGLISLTQTRAYENAVFFLSCNRVGTEDEATFSGRSTIASPLAEVLTCSATQEEEILRATLEADKLYEARAITSIFRDRRPEHYGLICQPF